VSTSNLGTPAALGDLVQYQDGAVVSHALVKEKTGTVTLFAFDAGESLSEHTAPFDALLLIVDGRATVTIDGSAHAMSAGEIVRLPANVPHAVSADEAFKMLLIMIRAAS
jgi:quercetin dioxygenase-like cupin family protein